MKHFKYFLVFFAIASYISIMLRSRIVVNVIKPSTRTDHIFDYHYKDSNSQVIFRHSHNNNVNHYHATMNGFEDLTVTGEMINIAPSAQKLISPEITAEKVQINSEIHHEPKLISQPTLFGYNQQVHEISGFDPFSGQNIHKNIVVNTPDIGLTHQV